VQFSGPSPSVDVPTGRCLIVVTPDAQRTMSTYLGVSELLGPDDVDDAVVASAQVLYMEGYLWDRPEAMAAYRKAAAVAHRAGGLVSLSLSDSFCVDRHREAFLDLVATEVDVLFANEAEVCALYDTDQVSQAYAMVSKHCDLAAITLGSKGSVVVERNGKVHDVPADPVVEVIDTTGAGDLYASGFLFGLTRQLPPAECGRLGSVAAAEVISHVGARPTANLARLAGLG
jgi:sugar/nucleoside kinase (ribokinase family)